MLPNPRFTLFCSLVFAVAWLAAGAELRAAAPAGYAGDGPTVSIIERDEGTGSLRGEIVRDGKTYPFTGQVSQDGTAHIIRGSFKAGDATFEFSTRQEAQEQVVKFTTGTKTFELRPVQEEKPG